MSKAGCVPRLYLNRREFIGLSAGAAAGAALSGCATNPVTGQKQLMLLSEAEEINIDRTHSPHQFSADCGPSQDAALNDYVNGVGMELGAKSHRPHMPYSFRVVNANYVNAYAFPGGSIAVTRGILVGLENEAELAALLGHELGHVNARHTAQQMTKGVLAATVATGLGVYMQMEHKKYAVLASGLGAIGTGALLASYSRDNEREADALGMEYMVRNEYNPQGMIQLMDLLQSQQKREPSAIERMFSSHPMSSQRYQSAVARARDQYAAAESYPLHGERFMDRTASLRRLSDAIHEMQKGDASMIASRYDQARGHYAAALKQAPDDYAGLLSMAKCAMAQKQMKEARAFGEQAKRVYPQEPQGYHVSGLAAIESKHFEAAYADFVRYEQLLPGNPNTTFFTGYSQEGLGRKPDAAQSYGRYLQMESQGEFAEHAYRRLVEWGYVKKPAQS